MSKKERNQETYVSFDPVEQPIEDSALLEADAYGSPQPEAGSDVTVMKPVGIGGPVPIVAPKHNTIQLQPIVVPLAVVPYMTQDSNVLRTDSRQTGGYTDTDEYAESTQFESVAQPKARKKRKNMLPRILTLVSFVFSVVMLLPFLVSYTTEDVGMAHISTFNIIKIISGWVEGSFSWSPAANLIYIVVAFLAAVQTVLLLVGSIIGKYPKPIIPIFSFINMGCLFGVLITEIVRKKFVVANEVGFLVIFIFSVLCFVLSVIFSVILNHREDRAEMENKRRSEI